MNVSDLPATDRPLYRLDAFGENYLSVVELLSLILRTDNSIAIAQQLIFKFKTLDAMKIASPQQLQCIKGIGKAQAGRVIACFEIAKRFAFNFEPKKPTQSPLHIFFTSRSKKNCESSQGTFLCFFTRYKKQSYRYR